MFLGLRTVIYPASDLSAAKQWYAAVTGVQPYFDEPSYVGFDVEGYELGLVPEGDHTPGPVTYWGVADVDAALRQLVAAGAREHSAVREVGDGIRLATLLDPSGRILGVIENPHFRATPAGAGAPAD